MIPTYFSERMVADIGAHISPSSLKPRQMARALERSGLPVALVEPAPVTRAQLERAHDPRFVREILGGLRANGFGNISADVIASLPYTSGAMLSATRAAIAAPSGARVAAALCSGFHHAGYDFSQGFCTFNGLMVAALALLEEDGVARVAILDCDYHYGNGTDDILERLRERGRDVRAIDHMTLGKTLGEPSQADAYLDVLRALRERWTRERPGVVLYQSGADVHVDDPLGGLLTSEEMRLRDRIVLETARALDVPIAWNLAGGYQRDPDGGIGRVIALHMQTFEEALRAFGSLRSP